MRRELRFADVGPRAHHRRHEQPASVQPILRRHLERHPDLNAARVAHRRRHHAHHLVELAVQLERAADEVRIAARELLPQPVAHDGDTVRAIGRLLRPVEAAELRPHAEHAREVAQRRRDADALRLAVARQRAVADPEPGDRLERVFARGQVQHLRYRERRVIEVERRDVLPHDVQPVQPFHRQRPEQHRVDQAEDRRVGADAERQRDDGEDREARRRAQRAPGVSQILQQAFHRFRSSGSLRREGVGLRRRAARCSACAGARARAYLWSLHEFGLPEPARARPRRCPSVGHRIPAPGAARMGRAASASAGGARREGGVAGTWAWPARGRAERAARAAWPAPGRAERPQGGDAHALNRCGWFNLEPSRETVNGEYAAADRRHRGAPQASAPNRRPPEPGHAGEPRGLARRILRVSP